MCLFCTHNASIYSEWVSEAPPPSSFSINPKSLIYSFHYGFHPHHSSLYTIDMGWTNCRENLVTFSVKRIVIFRICNTFSFKCKINGSWKYVNKLFHLNSTATSFSSVPQLLYSVSFSKRIYSDIIALFRYIQYPYLFITSLFCVALAWDVAYVVL